jgi:hypothetical protein
MQSLKEIDFELNHRRDAESAEEKFGYKGFFSASTAPLR